MLRQLSSKTKLFLSRGLSTTVVGKIPENRQYLFNSRAVDFLKELDKNFTKRHRDLLDARQTTTVTRYRGDTKHIRDDLSWKARKPDDILSCRHVEITGPTSDAKMMINALNSNANCYMTDIEDSMAPSWFNVLNAHDNIFNAVRGTLEHKKLSPTGSVEKEYKLKYNKKGQTPTFFTRVRGLHLKESGIQSSLDGHLPATLTDFGLYMANNGNYLVSGEQYTKGGIYFYVPKIQSYEEALYIRDVFAFGEEYLGIPTKSIQTTLLIETFPAIFQTDEIIYALRDYICGLNCGRWDYLFSLIKENMELNVPNRSLLTMDKPFLKAYVEQIVKSTHQRGIHAMGGMSAFIPAGSAEQNAEITQKIIKDKENEIALGCDGAWVAHPGLIGTVKELFETRLGNENQYEKIPNIDLKGDEFTNFGEELTGLENFTEKELRNNLNVALQYLAGWLYGNGAVALNNLMEDMATCEISLYQIKNWVHNNTLLSHKGGDVISLDVASFLKYLDEECELLKAGKGNLQVGYAQHKFDDAQKCIEEYILNLDKHFLPDVAYRYL